MIKYSAIDLQSLQSIYDTDILPYEYHYELDDGTFVSVRFEQSQLSHLLGIQKVDHSRADLKGQKCYDEIRNGNLTFTKLKADTHTHEVCFKGRSVIQRKNSDFGCRHDRKQKRLFSQDMAD